MNYNQARAKYWKKRLENPLPRLPEDERIYLNVTYATRSYAKYSHCGFDADKKLWFTGCLNANLYFLVDLYGVNEGVGKPLSFFFFRFLSIRSRRGVKRGGSPSASFHFAEMV